jgi:hypothetical protein
VRLTMRFRNDAGAIFTWRQHFHIPNVAGRLLRRSPYGHTRLTTPSGRPIRHTDLIPDFGANPEYMVKLIPSQTGVDRKTDQCAIFGCGRWTEKRAEDVAFFQGFSQTNNIAFRACLQCQNLGVTLVDVVAQVL